MNVATDLNKFLKPTIFLVGFSMGNNYTKHIISIIFSTVKMFAPIILNEYLV